MSLRPLGSPYTRAGAAPTNHLHISPLFRDKVITILYIVDHPTPTTTTPVFTTVATPINGWEENILNIAVWCLHSFVLFT